MRVKRSEPAKLETPLTECRENYGVLYKYVDSFRRSVFAWVLPLGPHPETRHRCRRRGF